MNRSRRARFLSPLIVLAALLGRSSVAVAADDTARFFGTWKAEVPVNGQTLTLVSIHDAGGYRNSWRSPQGDAPAGNGAFSAADGNYTATATWPNNSGTYRFLNDRVVVCTNAAGQTVKWTRIAAAAPDARAAAAAGPVEANVAAHRTTGYVPPTSRPGNETTNPPAVAEGARPAEVAYTPDPSLPPETNAAIKAFNAKDYPTAWREFMAGAKKGDAEAEAGVGAMLFKSLNPPGTGYYAQCEQWLLRSANQGNTKGMSFLAKYYFDSARTIAGGINPGVNNAPLSPQLRQQSEQRFRLARQWFERASEKGDLYAMGNLAIMLDSGVGGPADAERAAQLRARVKAGPDKDFARRATTDPGKLALDASWQAGHYAEALERARAAAAQGDASAEALLGRAYYLGVGVPRSFSTALGWLNKAVAQDSADGMFFLGLMYEHGYGVDQDIPRAEKLFDRAAAKGHRFAQMEVKGMRMQGESNRIAAQAHVSNASDMACNFAGGAPSFGSCLRDGKNIDVFVAAP